MMKRLRRSGVPLLPLQSAQPAGTLDPLHMMMPPTGIVPKPENDPVSFTVTLPEIVTPCENATSPFRVVFPSTISSFVTSAFLTVALPATLKSPEAFVASAAHEA